MGRVTIGVYKDRELNELFPAKEYSKLYTALSGGEGVFDMGADHKTMLLLTNQSTGECSVTIKAGNGVYGSGDLDVTLQSGTASTVWIESGRFKNVSGADKGKVIIKHIKGTLSIAVFEGP